MGLPGGTGGSGSDPWRVVVPVKRLSKAKTRLSPHLDPEARRALVLDMFGTVLRACSGAELAESVTVVTADPSVVDVATAHGTTVVPDPAEGSSDPLNGALTAALATVGPHPVAVVAADLPHLTSDLVDAVLSEASRHPHAFLPDHLGSGSVMAFWSADARPAVPVFGPGSAARFRAAGAVDLAAGRPDDWSAARRDVDTPDDLRTL